MNRAVLILLLMVATAAQPLVAIPAPCGMAGHCLAMSCAGCCAVNPCCALSEQQPSPISAITKANVDFRPAIVWQPLAVTVPLARPSRFSQFAFSFRNAHAPSPRALNCIQLI